MTRSLHRKFIAAVSAAAILLTAAGASQAQAGNRDTERFLGALVGLAVIGAIIAEDRKRDRRRDAARYDDVSRRDGYVEPRPLPRRVNRKLLPQHCMRSFGDGDRRIRMFPKRCLHRNYEFSNSLPLRCERRVRTDRGIREGYGVRCLKRHGYQLARR